MRPEQDFTPRWDWLYLVMLLSNFFIATPGTETRVYAQSNLGLIINEVYYDHPGSDTKHEWVELYNSGDTPIETGTDWRFFDGKSNRFLPSDQTIVSINPSEYVVITNDPEQFVKDYPDYSGSAIKVAFGSLLNSSADLKLSNDKGQSYFEEVSYESSFGGAGNGKSLERIDGGWHESGRVGGTPGQANDSGLEEPSPPSTPDPTEVPPTQSTVTLQSLEEIKQTPVGQKVRIQATVTAPAGLLSSKSFYVQDQSAGIQIYASAAPNISLGDEIEVIGKRSQSSGETRITAEEGGIKIVGHKDSIDGTELPLPAISDDSVGLLVKTSGVLIIESGKVMLTEDQANLEVLIRESTTIEKPKWRDGDSLTVTGIISRYQDRLRILPRYQSDLLWQDEQSTSAAVETESVKLENRDEPATQPSQTVTPQEQIATPVTPKTNEKNESAKTPSNSTSSKKNQPNDKKSAPSPVKSELAGRVKGLLSAAPQPQATDSPNISTPSPQPVHSQSSPKATRLPDIVYGIVIGSLALSLWQKKSSFQTIPKLLSNWVKGQPKPSVGAILSRFKEIWGRGKPPLSKD